MRVNIREGIFSHSFPAKKQVWVRVGVQLVEGACAANIGRVRGGADQDVVSFENENN